MMDPKLLAAVREIHDDSVHLLLVAEQIRDATAAISKAIEDLARSNIVLAAKIGAMTYHQEQWLARASASDGAVAN